MESRIPTVVLRSQAAGRRHARRRLACGVVAVAMLAGLASCGSDERPPRPSYDRLLHAAMRQGGAPPGVVALVRTPDGTWRRAVGVADLRTRRPLRVTDRFRIASVSKTFIATMVLQLVAEHRLSLDDPVGRRLPGVFAGAAAAVTLRQLLNHTSGLRNNDLDEFPAIREVIPRMRDPALRAEARRLVRRWRRGEDVVAGARLWIAAAAAEPLLWPPGSRFHYSNINYDVLGEIVEHTTGRPLAQELRRRILRPLGLRATSLATTASIAGPHAHGYLIGAGRPVDVTSTADDLRGVLGSGSGAIVSTIDDVARFYAALLGGRLLPARLLDAMLTPIRTPRSWADLPSSGYGLGQTRVELPCGRAWGHGGGMDGYLTEVIASRTGRRVAIVAVNASGATAGRLKTRLATQLYCATR